MKYVGFMAVHGGLNSKKGNETNHCMGLEQETRIKLVLCRNEWMCLILRRDNDGFPKTVFTHPREGLRTIKQRISYAGTHSALYL